MIDAVLRRLDDDDRHQKGKKKPDPPGQEVHVVACGAEDGVDRIALGTGEVVPFEVAVFLQMADDWLDAAAASHLAADGR